MTEDSASVPPQPNGDWMDLESSQPQNTSGDASQDADVLETLAIEIGDNGQPKLSSQANGLIMGPVAATADLAQSQTQPQPPETAERDETRSGDGGDSGVTIFSTPPNEGYQTPRR